MVTLLKSKIQQASAGFSVSQKVATAFTVIAVTAGVLFFANSASKAVMAPLYTDLSVADAALVTEQLRDANFSYELTDRGATVMVPEDQVYEARLVLSRTGFTPQASSDGFATLDNLGITSTQFQQQVAFQRGLAAEIESSLEKMASIESAQVSLVIPERDLFVNDDIKSSASVMLVTSSRLSSSQISAVTSLVAGAVEGLTVEQVTVSDQDGNVLAAPGFVPGAPSSDFDRTATFEAAMAADVLSLVEAVAGPGNARVAISADIDWSATSEVTETFTPVLSQDGSQLMSASSSRVESNSLDVAQGILGAGDVATVGNSDAAVLADIDSDFLVDRSVRTTEDAGGSVTSLSASVVVDSNSVSTADMATLTKVIEAATGLSVTDGGLNVAALPFDTSVATELEAAQTAADEAAAAQSSSDSRSEMIRTILIALFVAVAGFLTLRSFKKSKAAAATQSPLADLEALLAAPRADALPSAKTDLSALPASDRLSVASAERPAEVAELISTWMSDRVGAE